LSGSTASGAFHFVDTVPVPSESRLTPIYSLASHPIFERQILEDMKLKAPIEFALEITDKFKKSGASAPFQSASQFSKEAEALEKLLDKRNDDLDQAWIHAKALHDKAIELHSRYEGEIVELASLAEIIGIHNVDESKIHLSIFVIISNRFRMLCKHWTSPYRRLFKLENQVWKALLLSSNPNKYFKVN
jgi:hypothetical protein